MNFPPMFQGSNVCNYVSSLRLYIVESLFYCSTEFVLLIGILFSKKFSNSFLHSYLVKLKQYCTSYVKYNCCGYYSLQFKAHIAIVFLV